MNQRERDLAELLACILVKADAERAADEVGDLVTPHAWDEASAESRDEARREAKRLLENGGEISE